MNQYKCPIASCGRILENVSVLREHLERRHPTVNIETFMPKDEQERVMQQQINKLPKIKTLKQQETEHRLPQLYRRSSSKNKKETPFNAALNKSKIVSVIGQSKKIVENTENSHGLKRPSLGKKNSSMVANQPSQRLPELKAVNKVKLEKLGQSNLKLAKEHKSEMEVGSMNTTAPNFKNILRGEIASRQKSNPKKRSTLVTEESHQQKNDKTTEKDKDSNELLFIKTQEGFNDKFTKLHKHIEKRQYLKKKSDNSKEPAQPKQDRDTVEEQQNTIQKKSLKKQQEGIVSPKKKEQKLSVKTKPKREFPLKHTDSKKQIVSLEQYNVDQRVVVFKANVGPKLTLPATATLQFLYANNCKLSSMNLNNLENLREISIQHNAIKQISFLNYPNNTSIEKVFADHNLLTTLDYLPPNLIVLSVGFNNIGGLQMNSRELSKVGSLKQVDFSFNPIRKESHYKLHVIGTCFQLKKIDGIKVTKFDLELAAQYNKMLDEELGLVPSNRFKHLIVSKSSNSPSTEMSYGEPQPQQQTNKQSEQQMQKQMQKLQKTIKSTKNHMNIIHEQNEIIRGEIADLKQRFVEMEDSPQVLFDKLRNECAALELLNFLQYASQEQLQQLIMKKKRQLSVA